MKPRMPKNRSGISDLDGQEDGNEFDPEFDSNKEQIWRKRNLADL